MSSIKVNVKWNGKLYENIEVDLADPALIFKMQLFTLTGVEPGRQKIMVKGGTLKDEANISQLGWKNGQTLMMMGTAGALPQPPPATVFLEDMSESERNIALELPSGLENLGNTCYMNATLQCLRMIPELQQSLTQYSGSITGIDEQGNLVGTLRNLYQELSNSGNPVPPHAFLALLRQVFPEFATTTSNGYPMQHDAEECWSQLVNVLKAKAPAIGDSNNSTGKNFVDQFMTGQYESITKLLENPDTEPEVITREEFQKLDCHISIHTNYMASGITEALKTTLEKNSPSLGHSAMYQKQSKITRLPQYLVVHFIRFFWKSSENVRAKIMRRVKFPLDFDASELCTTDLQLKMSKAKEKLREVEKRLEEKKRESKKKLDALGEPSASTNANPIPKPVEDKEMDIDDGERIDWSESLDPELVKDVGCNPTGQYELAAVLTHRGASADSGHYISWVKKNNSDNEWFKYDDDKVSIVHQDEITKLEGGGEWHTAYILLYRAKKLVERI